LVVVVPVEQVGEDLVPEAETVILEHLYQPVAVVEQTGTVVDNRAAAAAAAHSLVILQVQVILQQ
jgi:hypothetical protein